MSKDDKINRIVERVADPRREESLNRIDADARTNHTWGSGEHRQARSQAEAAYDAQRTSYGKMTEEQLDGLLAAPVDAPAG